MNDSFRFPPLAGEPSSLSAAEAGPQSPTTPRTKRQFAYYPNMKSSNKSQKPFSRSAAKRESVMALGSIEHLQHYFTKSGIAAESDPLNKPHTGMVPAIGGPSSLKLGPSLAPRAHDFDLPPSPIIPQIVPPSFPPFVKTYETDPENLRPGVVDDLNAVAAGWHLNDGEVHEPDPVHDPNLLGTGEQPKDTLDVLELLKTTTRAVRSVRNYLVSLPDESVTPTVRADFRPSTLPSVPPPKRRVSRPDSTSDPLTRIRHGALEVLAVLRELEETARLPLEHDAYDVQSEHSSLPENSLGDASRGASPSAHLDEGTSFIDGDASVSISFIDVGGRRGPVPVWEDEYAYDQPSDEEREKQVREHWDERLVVGGGWLYRQDMRLADLAREREVVARYLDIVDEALFGGMQGGKRGWERGREQAAKARAGRRVSAGDAPGWRRGRDGRRVVSASILDAMRDMVVTEEPEEMETVVEEGSVEDEELPDWAKRSTFPDDPLGRLHALLSAFLPANLLPILPPSPASRADLLRALSSGQLLCTAYNVGVRRSRKPWGFVSKDAIHDIVALEAQADSEGERGKRGWTFRRTDNLRLWAAALKLRYLLSIVSPGKPAPAPKGSLTASNSEPAMPSSLPVRAPTPRDEELIVFDAPLIARQDSGWEDMLETVVLRWLDVVVEERRGER